MRPSLAELEKNERELFAQFHGLPNTKERGRIYKQWREVYNKITALTVV
jgi:hypothetical protein